MKRIAAAGARPEARCLPAQPPELEPLGIEAKAILSRGACIRHAGSLPRCEDEAGLWRGDGAPKDASLWCPRSCDRGGRLSARHTRSSSEAIAHLRNAHLRRSPRACHLRRLLEWFGTGPRFLHRVRIEFRPGFISWLLAGTRSGPGRSSDAARVRHAACMSPRAPRLVPLVMTPHERALKRTR